MPKFTIDHKSSKSANEAYTEIKKFLNTDQDIRRFDPNIQCLFNDNQKSAQMNGKQFKANLTVAEADTGSKIAVTVDLPFLLTPLKGKVTETLQKKLAKYLG